MTLAGVPLSYVWRNLAARRMTTLLTAGGLALVVFVFACTLMLAEGIRNTLVQTGQPDNVVVIRKGADTEVQSGISRGNADILSALPQIATNAAGTPLVSREAVVLITLKKRGTTSAGNVTVRGTTPEGLEIRPQVRLVEGRMFRMGTSEVIAGRSLGRKFDGAQLGDTLRF
ncbi:MAG: ABC transporter permease, partial [Betaproteobacteria bacterium]|nr:ABC transporter permease [Betaproteobacteria bacterium]